MGAFDLIIFDCDGTLVDSELLNNASTSQVLMEAGFPRYTTEYCLDTFIGSSQAGLWQSVMQESGKPLPADINQRFIDRVAANMDAMARPAPGIADLLAAVSQTHKICVGSNGERPNVGGCLKATGLIKYFPDDRIFTVENVNRPKPAPDLYLYAASQMGTSPDRCLVIEDSVAGATAGIAAGMKVFGYHGLAHDQAAQAEKLRRVGVHAQSANLADIITYLNA